MFAVSRFKFISCPCFMNQIEKVFKNRKVLVTGGYGFLGTNLTKALSGFDCESIRLGKKYGAKLVEGKVSISDQIGDVRNFTTWDKALTGVDIVFHLAAQTSEEIASADVISDLGLNVIPIVHMLEV